MDPLPDFHLCLHSCPLPFIHRMDPHFFIHRMDPLPYFFIHRSTGLEMLEMESPSILKTKLLEMEMNP